MTILTQDLVVDNQIKLEQEAKRREANLDQKRYKLTRIDYVLYSDNLNEWAEVDSAYILANDYEEAEEELYKHIPREALKKNHFNITSRQENITTINLITEPVKKRLYEWLKKEYENGK